MNRKKTKELVMTSQNNKLLLTAEEVIKELWGVEKTETTRKRLRQFIKKNKLAVLRLSDGGHGKIWIPRKEIDKFRSSSVDNSNRN